MKILKLKKNDRVYIATVVCFVLLMFVTNVSANCSQYIWLITNNLVGVAVTFMMLSIYPIRDFLKPFYIIWTFLGIGATIGGFYFWYTHQVGNLLYEWTTVPLNIWFLGAVVFKFIEEVFIRKSFKVALSKWEFVFVPCMLLMLISSSNTVWPLYYLIIFFLLWHTPFSKRQKNSALIGMIDGILLGVIILQAWAFFFSPYLEVRYTGIYGNCNRTACLYLVILAALIGKRHIYRITHESESLNCKEKKDNTIRIIDWIMALVFAFIYYTGSRTGMLGAVLIMLINYYFSEHRFFRHGIRKLIVKNLAYLAMTVVIIPFLYFPIRYIPEVTQFAKIAAKNLLLGREESYQPVGGVGFSEAVTNPVIRLFERNRSVADDGEDVPDVDKISDVGDSEEKTDIIEIEHDSSGKYYNLVYEFKYYPERGTYTTKVPRIIYPGILSVDYRVSIAAALIDQMNLTGHLDDEVIMRIRSDVPNAYEVYSNNEQNYIIHYLYVYGVPIGILVIILMISEMVYLIRRSLSGRSDGTIWLLLISVYFIYGLTEIVWVPGQIEQLLLFFAPLFFEKYDSCVIAEK